MHKGIIADLGDRQSGHIKERGIKEDIFFHADALSGISFKDLRPGDQVQFDMTESLKGPYATRVTKG